MSDIQVLEGTIIEASESFADKASTFLATTFGGGQDLELVDSVKVFSAEVTAFVGKINTTLESDEDFSVAKTNVKACLETSKKLKEVYASIKSGAGDVNLLLTTVEGAIEQFDTTRTTLNKAVKTETDRKKKEISDKAMVQLKEHHKGLSVAKYCAHKDGSIFADAMKNKSKFESMESSVATALELEISRLDSINEAFKTNIATIEAVGKKHLFPDINKLALESPELVGSAIEARVAKFETEELKRKQREEEAERAKKEKERIAAEKEASLAAKKELPQEQAKEVVITEQELQPVNTVAQKREQPPVSGNGPDLPVPPELPPMDLPPTDLPPTNTTETFVLTVTMNCEQDEAISRAKHVKSLGFGEVQLTKG